MRVLVLTPYLYGRAPGPRSSIELWQKVLEPHGIQFEYAAFGDERLHDGLYAPGNYLRKAAQMLAAYASRGLDLRQLHRFDAVLIYREAALLGPELFEWIVARSGLPIIYQLDDPLYVPYRSPHNGYLSYLKFFGKVGRIARMSAMTIVNSTQHREYVSRYVPSERIRQIPIFVDGLAYAYRPPIERSDGRITIGWTGSKSTMANLRVILEPLRAMSARDDVKLLFIGADAPELPGVEFEQLPWRSDTEVDDLRRLDVGLVPLPVDERTKRKFFMKTVQYAAVGIPSVCTPLGSNPEVVQDGMTGFLADSDETWVSVLATLVADQALRESMGRLGSERAHARYTMQSQGSKVVEAFQRAVELGNPRLACRASTSATR